MWMRDALCAGNRAGCSGIYFVFDVSLFLINIPPSPEAWSTDQTHSNEGSREDSAGATLHDTPWTFREKK